MERLSQRQAYGEALVELGGERRDIVVLEADLGRSTMSNLFEQAYPERYFEMGIAEANMMSTAAGLAASGKTAFCSTFAVFAAGRPYDQIRQTISIGRLNVKICGSSSGLSDFGDGSTHQAIEDISLMSAIPGMTGLTPCDAYQARQAVRLAAETEGPVYIRIVRNDVPVYTLRDDAYPTGLQCLREGGDVAILAYGVMVEAAMEAAERLAAQGVAAGVYNVPVMKPFDSEGLRELAARARGIVTAEDHTYLGGLASHAALALAQSATPLDYVAVMDEFGQSAHGAVELMEHYGLTAKNIAAKAKALLG